MLYTLRKTGRACFLLVLGGLVISCGGAVDGPLADVDSEVVDGLGTEGTVAETTKSDVVPDQVVVPEVDDGEGQSGEEWDDTDRAASGFAAYVAALRREEANPHRRVRARTLADLSARDRLEMVVRKYGMAMLEQHVKRQRVR